MKIEEFMLKITNALSQDDNLSQQDYNELHNGLKKFSSRTLERAKHDSANKKVINFIGNFINQHQEQIANMWVYIKQNDRDSIKKLISNNMWLNFQDHNGNAPLHLATAYNHRGIVTDLLDAGADTIIVNYKGETPFDYAKKNHMPVIAQVLSNAMLRQTGKGSDLCR